MMELLKVLFFCSANSCRSPAAAGICRSVVEELGVSDHFYIESAGTHASFGRGADPETVRVAQKFGVDLREHRSRPLEAGDFREFDLLVGMDLANIDAARSLAPKDHAHKLVLLLDGLTDISTREVPDPYRAPDGFVGVHSLIARGVRQLVTELGRRYELA